MRPMFRPDFTIKTIQALANEWPQGRESRDVWYYTIH